MTELVISWSRKSYVLVVLMLVLASSQIDRVALGIMMQDIKQEMALSDTELGLLTGIAFALFYSIVGVPLARLADRRNRSVLLAITAGLWSIAVACTGAATSFGQLLLTRVTVAVGEAGCLPIGQALLADYFTRDERPRATARFMLGYPIAAFVGYFSAGWLNERFGWRMSFLLLAVPGVLLALVVLLTIRDPRGQSARIFSRSMANTGTVDSDAETESVFASPADGAVKTGAPRAAEVATTLWRNRPYRHLLLAWSIMVFFGTGTGQWKPSFFLRSFHLSALETGTWLAIIYGVTGLVGMTLGGELGLRLGPASEATQLRWTSRAFISFGALSAAIYLAPTPLTAFSFLALSLIGIYFTYGPIFAAIQLLVPDSMRATALAFVYLCANLIGMGLGPLAVGALSDLLRPFVGEESLRYALLLMSPGYGWAAWHLWRASTQIDAQIALLPNATACPSARST